MSHSHGRTRPRAGLAAAVGGWSARHRKTAVIGWLALVVLAVVLGGMAGRVEIGDSEQIPGEYGTAVRILDEAGLEEPAAEMVLVQAKGKGTTTDDPAFRSTVDDVLAAVRGTKAAENIRSPYSSGAVSADKRSALVQFEMSGTEDEAASNVGTVMDAVAEAGGKHEGLRVEQFGEASSDKEIDDIVGGDFRRAEWTAVPLALGILLIAFGALVAALLPVALALTAFIGATGLVAVASHSIHTSDDANSVMLLVGLAVGVDYCLFYLRREREERAAGHDADTALRIAAATSGRAVLISGLTVMAAMAGMFFTGFSVFKAMGAATILVVAVAVVGSLTVLPALLSLLGDRIEKGKVPFLHRAMTKNAGKGSRFWSAALTPVLRHPAGAAAVAGGALVLLALPALGMNTANLNAEQELGPDVPIIQASRHINQAFPGGSDPAQVVVRAPDITAAPVAKALDALSEQAVSSGASKGPVHITLHEKRHVAVVEVPLVGDGGNDSASKHSLETLREKVLPATVGQVDGVERAVAGNTAASVDFSKQLGDSVLPVFGFVLALAFLLMLLSFRSVTIAATTVVLNMLSVGAAYGVLTLVFQHGWGAGLVGTEGVGAVQAWLPLFLFVILFGLSMDYHVFVVSRIREARMRGLSTRAAVQQGITTTAGVVTSAAVIMVGVFAVFGTLSMQTMKQMGVGLAVAVLIDATVIRAVLLPAVMTLLGERNWYMPRWLRWLPDMSERPVEHLPAAPRRPEREPVRV